MLVFGVKKDLPKMLSRGDLLKSIGKSSIQSRVESEVRRTQGGNKKSKKSQVWYMVDMNEKRESRRTWMLVSC